MGFGQLVIGPPGSGKTTYCNGMAHYFSLTNRPCAVINLDPANHDAPYDADVSVEELITLDDAMAYSGDFDELRSMIEGRAMTGQGRQGGRQQHQRQR